MSGFEHVLVPVDLTDRNASAVAMAARLVEAGKGVIHLLHVIETIPGVSLDEERSFYERLEKSARKHLETMGARLESEGHVWRADVVYGSRARSILEEAKRLEADIIVIRSHRLDETTASEPNQGWGTLSYQVGILAQCPVLLVK